MEINSNPNATLGSTSPITTTTIQASNEPEDDEILTADLKTEDIIFILLIVSFSLAVGTIGFTYTTKLNLLDSFYTSSMILSTMGLPLPIETVGGKLFSSFFALFSAFVIIIVITVFVNRFISDALD
jgi:hypothetical protein